MFGSMLNCYQSSLTMALYHGKTAKYSCHSVCSNHGCDYFIPHAVCIKLIPFERPILPTHKKDEVLTFKLCSDPANKNSATYNLTIPFFKNGSPKELFLFLDDVKKVIIGQHIHDPAGQYALMHRLLQGDALAYFNHNTLQHVEEGALNFATCINKLIMHILLACALKEQCHYMHRFIQKPHNVPARRFVTRLFESNEYLQRFPPFRHNHQLPLHELLDIAEFAVP